MKKITWAVSAILLISGLAIIPGAFAFTRDNDYQKIASNINIFNDVVREVNMFYVDSIDIDKHSETAVNAFLYNIDPYTQYIPQRETEDFNTINTGEYGGIGSAIMANPKGKGAIISGPYEDSPAYNAGLRTGDLIVSINGDSIADWKLDKVSSTLKGTPNTQLEVKVIRPYVADSIRTFTITRRKIVVNPVPYYGVIRDNIGYIRITSFNGKTADNTKEALLELKKNPSVKSIMLDMRGNGGGLINEAEKIASFFLPKGTLVVQTRGRMKQSEKSYKTTTDPIDTEIPLTILIDGNSASATELLTGALQDHDRAVVIGSRSFGKGLVQTTRELDNGSMVKITIAKYYTPSGRLVQAIDYSHRNADGEAERIPDSLTNVFHTDAGREVRDGGGITPDIKVEPHKYSNLAYIAASGNWIFNYATKYCAEHATIAQPEDFKIDDATYEDFINSIDPVKFGYDKIYDKYIDHIRKLAEEEGALNDSTKLILDNLSKALHHDIRADFQNNKKEISTLIESEIVERYYFERGITRYNISHDEDIDAAQKMLNTAGEYEKILRKPTKKVKSNKSSKKKK